MKRLSILFFVLLCTSLVNARTYSVIKGKITAEKIPSEISLQYIEDGRTHIVSTYNVDVNGFFGFFFDPPKEGIYLIGSSDSRNRQYPIYIKGGEQLDLTIKENEMIIEGGANPENKILARWELMSAVVKTKSHYWMGINSTYRDFFPDFIDLVSKIDGFMNTIDTKNEKFNKLMKSYVKYSMEYYALNFLMAPRTEHPQPSDLIPYYKSLVSNHKFPDDDILNIPFGMRYISLYTGYAAGSNRDNDNMLAMLGTDKQRAEFLVSNVLPRIKDYDIFLDFKDKYLSIFTSKAHLTEIEDFGAKLYDTRSGGAAANFTYPDTNGKMVSLSDFKGKVVLVDVWATWCGPCKAQIPALKKLEEELHGMDVVILSVSVDEEKDKQKWLDMIESENLGGVHLFASGWSKITKDYKITGIPRFMLFDKNGNIISTDAPRPSDPSLKSLILKYLK